MRCILHKLPKKVNSKSTSYSKCLRISLTLSPTQLAASLGLDSAALAVLALESQLEQFQHVTYRLHALIHALVRHHYPEFWQEGHYQTLTICDGSFIIFHSDDFAPRAGWRDLLPRVFETAEDDEL